MTLPDAIDVLHSDPTEPRLDTDNISDWGAYESAPALAHVSDTTLDARSLPESRAQIMSDQSTIHRRSKVWSPIFSNTRPMPENRPLLSICEIGRSGDSLTAFFSTAIAEPLLSFEVETIRTYFQTMTVPESYRHGTPRAWVNDNLYVNEADRSNRSKPQWLAPQELRQVLNDRVSYYSQSSQLADDSPV